MALAESKGKVKIHIPSAQVLTLFTSPVVLIPAPGVGKIIVPIRAVKRLTGVTVPYDTFTNAYIKYDTATNIVMNDSGIISSTVDNIGMMSIVAGDTSIQVIENKALIMTDDGDPLNGDGDLDIYVMYRIVTL